jgi:hypothetical protein
MLPDASAVPTFSEISYENRSRSQFKGLSKQGNCPLSIGRVVEVETHPTALREDVIWLSGAAAIISLKRWSRNQSRLKRRWEAGRKGSYHDHRKEDSTHVSRLIAKAIRRGRRTVTPGDGRAPRSRELSVMAICKPQQICYLPGIFRKSLLQSGPSLVARGSLIFLFLRDVSFERFSRDGMSCAAARAVNADYLLALE